MEQSWITETINLIEELEADKNKLSGKLEDIRTEIDDLDSKINGAKALVQKYRLKYGVLPLPMEDIKEGYFKDMTYPQVLKALAEKNDGYLRVIDAVDAILKAGYADTKKHAQPSIYSTIRRLKGQFTKIRPGEYRLVRTNGDGIKQDSPSAH